MNDGLIIDIIARPILFLVLYSCYLNRLIPMFLTDLYLQSLGDKIQNEIINEFEASLGNSLSFPGMFVFAFLFSS